MRLGRLLVACTLVLSLALAGCAAKAGSEGSASPSQSGSLSAARTTSGAKAPPAPAATTAPGAHTVSLKAAVLNGTAPLNVTFTVNATGTDPKTTWSLAFGDGNQTTGATFPANVTHRYARGGNLTATLTARFGDDSTANATVLLSLVAGSAGPSVAQLHKTGKVTATMQGPGAPTPVGCGLQGEGKDKFTYTWLFNSTATNVKIDLAIAGTDNDFDLYFLDPAGKEIKSSAAFNAVDGSKESIAAAGPYVPGAYKVQVVGCIVVNGSFTLDATADVA
ncbi:MAG TPA: PKD domain-containing protein [Candidatus Thermoplasmatota archaeon]|nr:PKD domain-containing protein [Candidatus Thermoplasmatota archaeon]